MSGTTVQVQARTLFIGAVVAVLVLSAGIGVARWQIHKAQRAAGASALQADTTRAHFDTSHAAALSSKDSTRLLGDSLRAVQRSAIQVAQQRDALDKALGLQRVALLELTAQVRALTATVESGRPVVQDSAGTRSAHFDVRSEPYTVAADVTLPLPPGRGNMAVQVTLDPATVNIRPGCGAVNASGIREATATVTGPVWLPLKLGRVEQDPALCASPALQQPGRSWWRRILPHVSAGYGLTLTNAGTVYPGWQLGAVYEVWHPP